MHAHLCLKPLICRISVKHLFCSVNMRDLKKWASWKNCCWSGQRGGPHKLAKLAKSLGKTVQTHINDSDKQSETNERAEPEHNLCNLVVAEIEFERASTNFVLNICLIITFYFKLNLQVALQGFKSKTKVDNSLAGRISKLQLATSIAFPKTLRDIVL